MATDRQVQLIDAAALGSIDAAAQLAEGYFKGEFGTKPNYEKSLKWAKYAAKRGNEEAAHLVEVITAMEA